MKEIEPKNGIIYCRVSSAEQVDGTSLESQEKVCREYAKRENITVAGVFIEKGESAKTANRTEFIKAISFCSERKKKIECFIVYKLDRFARNQVDHITVRETLKKYGTELKSVTEPIGDTSMGKMMEGILSTFAEFDNNIRTERSIGGMKKRLEQGTWVWRAPLGYCRVTKGADLSHDPKLASYVKLAFEEYSKGIHTFKSLANFLNERGFVTKQGNYAVPSLMEKMITNPLYAGIIKVWDFECRGKFPPIVSEELFNQCNGNKKRQNIPRLSKNPNFPLRKLVVCESCTSPITGSASTGRGGKKYPYYHHHKQTCDNAKFISKDKFEKAFTEYLITITPSKRYEKILKEIIIDIWKNNYQNVEMENRKIEKEISVSENQLQRVFDLHQSGIYTDKEFLNQKNIVSRKIGQKKLLLHEVNTQDFNIEEALDHCFNIIRNTSKTWIELGKEPEERLCFQKLIFTENIKFSGEKFGTTGLSLLYKLNQEYGTNKSQLVTI